MRNSKPIVFLARKQEDGKYCIFNVDVFGVGGSIPTAALSQAHVDARTNFITKKWCAEAVARHQQFRAETGNVPPGHWQHHNDKNNDERPKVGYGCELRLGAGLKAGNDFTEQTINGESTLIAGALNPDKLYMNFRGIEPDAFEAIRNERLPFRSVEILDPSVPDIGSVAFMYSRPPFFGLRPLVVVLDESRTEPAFKFQPAPLATTAQFSSTGKTRSFFTFMENREMKTQLLALAQSLKHFSSNERELTVRLRLAFAADSAPPEDDEMKDAAKKAFATEEPEAPAVDKDGKPIAKAPAAKLSAEEEEAAKKEKEAKDAGQPAVKMEAGGFPPKKDEKDKEEKTDVPKGDEDKAINEKAAAQAPATASATPPAAPQPAAAVPPATTAQPAAAGAPAQAGAMPVPGTGVAGQPSPGAQQAGQGVSTMIQGILEQAFAPLVQEVRGLLAGTAQGAPPVNQLAPMVSMAALKWAAAMPEKFVTAYEAALKEPAKFAAVPAAPEAAPAELPAMFKAELSAAQAVAAEATAKLKQFDAKFAEFEAGKKFEARKASFRSRLEEEVRKSGNSLRIDVESVAFAAAEMPVQSKKFMSANGKVEDREVDMGETHLRHVLEQAGLTAPPPPASFTGHGRADVDDMLTPYANNTRAFTAAQVAAKDWDDNKSIQRMTKKDAYIATEVRFATGFTAAGSNGNGRKF